jgi:hypothetical protein
MTGNLATAMTPDTGNTPCPAPSRFWEVAGGDSWQTRERLHVASCPHCQAAEHAISSALSRAAEEPEPSHWIGDETVEDVEQTTAGWATRDSVSLCEASVSLTRLYVDCQSTKPHEPFDQSGCETGMARRIPNPADSVDAHADFTRSLDSGVSTAGGWSALPARFGDYHVIKQIAAGGMGVVFKARDVALNRMVAIKVMHRFGRSDDHAMDRFLREARISAGLNHRSIARIFNVGQIDGMPYIVSDFVEGKCLSECAPPHGRIAPVDLARIIALVADALHHAHKLGIIHRDVKPSNILIDQELCPHLIDFGLARSRADGDEASLSHAGQIVGTPSYMSPEQAQARIDAIGPASDVYSLGATLYTLLAGRPPFRGDGVFETIQLLTTVEPAPPSQFNPTIPRDLETICLKALAKDPRKRYATAGDMADDLRRFQQGSPISARAPGARERAARLLRRHRFLFLMTLIAVAASIFGACSALLALRYGKFGPHSANTAAVALDAENHRAIRLAVNRGAEAKLRRTVKLGEARVRDQPSRRDNLQSLASTYHRLGNLFVNTDRFSEAEWAYDRAVKLLRQCIKLEAGDASSHKELADVLCNFSEVVRVLGETHHARELYREAEMVRRRLGAEYVDTEQY